MRFQTDTSRQTHHIEVLCVANEQEHEGISHELCIGYWTKMVAKYYSHLLLSSSKAAGCLIPPHSNSFSMINTEKLHKNSFSTNSTRSNARKNTLTTCANGTTPAPVKSMSAPARSRSLAWDLSQIAQTYFVGVQIDDYSGKDSSFSCFLSQSCGEASLRSLRWSRNHRERRCKRSWRNMVQSWV